MPPVLRTVSCDAPFSVLYGDDTEIHSECQVTVIAVHGCFHVYRIILDALGMEKDYSAGEKSIFTTLSFL
jgi:hypothetical protein